MPEYCKAITKKGKRCGNYVKDTDFCQFHNSRTKEQKKKDRDTINALIKAEKLELEQLERDVADQYKKRLYLDQPWAVVIGFLCLAYSTFFIVTGKSCEGDYFLYPDKPFSSPVVRLTFEACSTTNMKDLRALSAQGAGVGEACYQLEKCMSNWGLFSWRRFPYIVLVLGCFFLIIGFRYQIKPKD